jgi:hypothetical protein
LIIFQETRVLECMLRILKENVSRKIDQDI